MRSWSLFRAQSRDWPRPGSRRASIAPVNQPNSHWTVTCFAACSNQGKNMPLAERTRKITPPSTTRVRELANELKAAGVDVINFAAGELDGDANDHIKSAAKLAIDKGCNKYTPTLGTKQLRKGLAEMVSKRCGTRYTGDEVGVTAGA